MKNILLSPPVAFLILLALFALISLASKLLSAKGILNDSKEKSYACGQNTDVNKIQPNYNEFFPFAFFFTIMHVTVLIVATMTSGGMWLAVLYLAAAVLALRVLFRR